MADTIHTDDANPESGFGLVVSIERPLSSAQRLVSALILLTESLDEPGGPAMNEIVWTIQSHLEEIGERYSDLFRLHHPNREQFERNGWPSDA